MSMINTIEQRLSGLQATHLHVQDDGHLHAGHEGAKHGGHFTVTIVSERFSGVPLVSRHRLVYDACADLMQNGIHALAIRAYTPEQWAGIEHQKGQV